MLIYASPLAIFPHIILGAVLISDRCGLFSHGSNQQSIHQIALQNEEYDYDWDRHQKRQRRLIAQVHAVGCKCDSNACEGSNDIIV